MRSELLHIYGPFSIHSFGLFIVLGILLFTWLALKHPLRKYIMSSDQFIETLGVGTLIGIIGARMLYVATEWHTLAGWGDSVAVWEGGFSLLGAVISILLFLPLYLKKIAVPILPFYGLIALHAPLLQAIARLGCFFAGCCYGSVAQVPWAIIYHDTTSVAPLCIPLHPVQLYSACMLFFIFVCMYFIFQRLCSLPGQLLCIYLMLLSIERFIHDFFRGDREYISLSSALSFHQYIALGIFICSGVLLLFISTKRD